MVVLSGSECLQCRYSICILKLKYCRPQNLTALPQRKCPSKQYTTYVIPCSRGGRLLCRIDWLKLYGKVDSCHILKGQYKLCTVNMYKPWRLSRRTGHIQNNFAPYFLSNSTHLDKSQDYWRWWAHDNVLSKNVDCESPKVLGLELSLSLNV